MHEDDESSVQSWTVFSEASYDSDKIDSDIEAELYSAIHHEFLRTPTSDLTPNTASPIENGQNSYFHAIAETQEVKVIKDYNITKSKVSDALSNDLNTSFETCKIRENISCTNLKEKPVVMNGDLCANNKAPEVKAKKSSKSNFKRKFEVLITEIRSTEPILDNIKSNENENNAKQKSKKQKTTNSKNLAQKSANKPIVVDSSDSDSIIWSDDYDVQPIEIQTNLNKDPEVVALSSDSFSDDSFDPLDDVCLFKGSLESSQQIGPSSSSSNPWQINSEDLYRCNKRGNASRYHEKAVLHCTNCKLKGHTFKFCSAPKSLKCFICGEDHMGASCRSKVCKKCFRVGHDIRYCTQRFVEVCDLCNMRGHPIKYCPDLWRRYHVTTTSGKIVNANPLPQKSPIYCFNCGEQGHNGAICRTGYPDKNSFPTWTSVIAIEHPNETIKRRMAEQRHVALGGTPNWSPISPYQQQHSTPCQSSTQKKKKKKKKLGSEDNSQTPKSAKKKKNKKNSNLNTSKDRNETATKSMDFSFPRTPKSGKKKNGKQKNNRSILVGLHRRLGTSSATNIQNNFV